MLSVSRPIDVVVLIFCHRNEGDANIERFDQLGKIKQCARQASIL
ncbi:MAG: hypothetical protein U1E36_02350 [Rickettsiales bacterium]